MSDTQPVVSQVGNKWFVDGEAVFTEQQRGEECAYVEPCGAAPDGYWFPVRHLRQLVDQGVIVPHFYEWDGDREQRIASGIAFDVYGESETPENDRLFDKLEKLGGHA